MSNESAEQPDGNSGREAVTRFDAPHRLATKEAVSSALAVSQLALASAGVDENANAEQLQDQASQLAQHLLERQQELVKREDELRARHAELGVGPPPIREVRESDLLERVSDVSKSAAEDERISAAERQAQLNEADEILRYQRRQLSQAVEQAEAANCAAKEAIESSRQQLANERQRFEKERAEQLDLMANRRADLSRREEAVQQRRLQVLKVHQETLEWQLILENAWLELGKVASPAETTRKLDQVRERLAAQYRGTTEEIGQQQTALDKAAEALALRAEQVRHQQAKLKEWFDAQQTKLDKRTTRATALEAEVSTERQRLRLLEKRWASERDELLSRIKKLLVSGS
jgi:hypothetical protein